MSEMPGPFAGRLSRTARYFTLQGCGQFPDDQMFYLLHRRLRPRFGGDRRDAPVGESAGVDAREPLKVGRHVQCEPVHGDITRRTDSYCADLARPRLSGVDPDPRGSGDASRCDAVFRDRADHGLLQRFDILPQADADTLQVEDRIAYQLPGAVEGDVAAAVDVKELCAHRFERFAAYQQVFGMAAFAECVYRRVFHQKDRACAGGAFSGGA